MTKLSKVSDPVRVIIANIVPLALMWVISFALVRTVEHFSLPTTLAESGQLVGIIVGAVLAWKLQGRVALFLLALFFAWVGALLIAHLRYGVHLVNGGPVQFTIMLASLIGLIVGTVMSRSRSVAPA